MTDSTGATAAGVVGADVAHGGSDDPRTSFRVDTLPRGLSTGFTDYVARIRGGDPGGLPAVLGLLDVAEDLGLEPSVGRPQELVYDALAAAGDSAGDELLALGEVLGLVV